MDGQEGRVGYLIRSVDELVKVARDEPPSREVSLAITNLQQARLWLEEALRMAGASAATGR